MYKILHAILNLLLQYPYFSIAASCDDMEPTIRWIPCNANEYSTNAITQSIEISAYFFAYQYLPL